MNDRIERLTDAHGAATAQGEFGSAAGWAWRVQSRILVLYARGRAQLDGAQWATDVMDRLVAEEHSARGRRVYLAWSFEDIHGYRPDVGMHFVRWFEANRAALNRLMVYTENSILRMTARATSITFAPGGMTFPRSAAAFDRGVDAWAEHVRSGRGRPRAS
ncbi:MAG: hypothetical protein AAGH15_21090 [Myxococcota bacterium]